MTSGYGSRNQDLRTGLAVLGFKMCVENLGQRLAAMGPSAAKATFGQRAEIAESDRDGVAAAFDETCQRLSENLGRFYRDHRALRRDRDEALRASRAKTAYISHMSHELRTPLNAILGFSQLLEYDTTDALSPAQRERVGNIVQAGNHVLALVGGILDLAKVEAGKVACTIEDVETAAVVEDCVRIGRGLAEAAGIALEARATVDPLPPLRADRQLLTQVLVNFLSNAVKYNRPNGSVALTCEMTAKGAVRISVVDTGEGVEAEKLDEVFEPFKRLVADPGAVPGTGLGLAISRQLVELMGGRIGCASVPGEGSTFWVEFARAGVSTPPLPPVPA